MSAVGRLVYRDHWDNQLVEIFDKGDLRSLYFGGRILQSAMSLSVPQALVLSYTRFMMAPLLADPNPGQILMVGVGAGSLTRFIAHYLPESRQDAVDCSPRILGLAQTYFQVKASERLRLHCEDGFSFLERRPAGHYQLILVDAFDQQGMASSVYCREFFALCASRLAPGGILSLNLWSGDQQKMLRVRRELDGCFEKILALPVPNRGNVICLAGSRMPLEKIRQPDRGLAASLSRSCQVDFKKIVRVCARHNPGLRQRLRSLLSPR